MSHGRANYGANNVEAAPFFGEITGTIHTLTGLFVQGPIDGPDISQRMIRFAIQGKMAFEMPCGATVALTGADQKCPNSDNCSAGGKECWAERYMPAKG